MDCSICLSEPRSVGVNEQERLKHLPIYVIGSEGINICFECEIMLVEHIRRIRTIAAKARKDGYALSKNKR